MPNLNKVMIIGHVGKYPEFKDVGGTSIVNFSVATSEKYKDKSDKLVEITEWHNVVMFGKLAEIANAFVKKGDPIYVEGKIKTEKYTDKNGVERYATKIIANNMQMLSSKSSVPSDSKSSKQENVETTDDFDDEIPF